MSNGLAKHSIDPGTSSDAALRGLVVISTIGMVAGSALVVEVLYAPPYWVHALLWGPLILLTTLAPLRPTVTYGGTGMVDPAHPCGDRATVSAADETLPLASPPAVSTGNSANSRCRCSGANRAGKLGTSRNSLNICPATFGRML